MAVVLEIGIADSTILVSKKKRVLYKFLGAGLGRETMAMRQVNIDEQRQGPWHQQLLSTGG